MIKRIRLAAIALLLFGFIFQTVGYSGMNESDRDAEVTETSTVSEDDIDIEIIDSKYQSIHGYSWKDLYVILILITQTSPLIEDNTPVFSLVSIDAAVDPVLIIGLRKPDSSIGSYTMYTTDRNRVYELLQTEDCFYWDSEQEAFYLSEDDAWYAYSPHVLLKSEANGLPEHAKPLTMYDITDLTVTSETIENYLLNLQQS